MENELHDRSVGLTPVSKQREKRRTSILKPPKTRVPLQELSALQTENELTATTTTGGRLSNSKRVSFAASQVKEFRTDANFLTMWGSSYYEDIYRSSDSSHQTDSSNSDGQINPTEESTKFLEDSRHHQPLQKDNSSCDEKVILGNSETEPNPESNLSCSTTLPSSLQKKMLRSSDDSSTNINIYSNLCSKDNLSELEDKCLQVGGSDLSTHYSPQNHLPSLTSRMNTGTSSYMEQLFHKHIASASDGDNDDSDDLCKPSNCFKRCAQGTSPVKLTCEVDYVSNLPNKKMLRFEKDVALPDKGRESRCELHCISTSSTKEENSDLSKGKQILPLYKVGAVQLSPKNVSPKASCNNSPPIFNNSPPFPNKYFFFQKSISPSNCTSFIKSNYNSGNVSCQNKVKSQTFFRHNSNINKSGHKILNAHKNVNSLGDFSKGGSSYLKNVDMPHDTTTNKVQPTREAQLLKKSLTEKQDIMFSNLQRNALLEREGHEYLSSSVKKVGINSEDSYRNMELTEAPGNILHVNKSKYFNNSLTSGSISEFTETCGNILGSSELEAGSVSSGGHRSSVISDRMELILSQPTQEFKATLAQKQEAQYSDSKRNDSTNNSGKHVLPSVQNMKTFDSMNESMEMTETGDNILDISQRTSESTVDFTEAGGNILCDQVKIDDVISVTKDEIKLLACRHTQELNAMFSGRKELQFLNKGGNIPAENAKSHLSGFEDKGVLSNLDISMEITETSGNIMDVKQTQNYDQEVTSESIKEFTEACGKIIDKNQVEVDHMSLSDENQSLNDRVNYQVLKNTSNGKQQFHASNKRRNVSLEKSKHLSRPVNTVTSSNRSMEMTEAPGNILEINQTKNFDLSTTGNTIDFTETYGNILNGNQVDADHLSLPKDKLLGKNVVFSEQKPVKKDFSEQMVQFVQKTSIANKPAWQQQTLLPEKTKIFNGSEESMEMTEASQTSLVQSQTDCDHITPDSSIEFTEAYGKIIGRNQTETDLLSESGDSCSPSMNIHPNKLSINQEQKIHNTQFGNKARNVSIDSAGHLLVCFRNKQTVNRSDRSMEVTESSGNIIGSNQTKCFDCSMAESIVDCTETFGVIFNKNKVDSEHILPDDERSLTFDNRMILTSGQPQRILTEETGILHAQLSHESKNTSENARHHHLSDSVSTVETLNCSNRRLNLTDAPGCILEANCHITPETSIELTDACGNIFEGNEVESDHSLPKECQSFSGNTLIASEQTQLLTDDSSRKQEISCLNKRRTKSFETTRQQQNIALFNSSDESSDLVEAPCNILDISQTKNCNQSVTPESVMEFTKACGNILNRSQLDHEPLQKENQSFSNDEKMHCSQRQVLVHSLSTGKEVHFSHKSRHCSVETAKSHHQSGIVESTSTFSNYENYLELSDNPENILAANRSKNFSHSLIAENSVELTEAGGRVLERNEMEVDLTSLSAEGPSPVMSPRTESIACQSNQKLVSSVEESDISSRQQLFDSDLNVTLNSSDRYMKVSEASDNIPDGNITNYCNQSMSSENSMEYDEAPADTSRISSSSVCLSASDESMEFTTSVGRILIGSNLSITDMDNRALCDTTELKDDKYQQGIAGNSLNCDQKLGDNQMSVVGAENVELSEGVICSPVNILNHASSGKSHADVNNHHVDVTMSGGTNLNITNMDNRALCDTSELKDCKYQQEIAGNSLNSDKNLCDNQMSVVRAENVELTEGVICSPRNILNHETSGRNVGHVDVNDRYHMEHCNSPTGSEKSLFLSASEKSHPSVCQITSIIIDDKVCVAEISSPAKKKIKLCDEFLEMDKSQEAVGEKNEMKDPLSNGSRKSSKVSPNNENDMVTKEDSCSSGKNHISDLSTEFSTMTNKITVSESPGEIVSESNIESEILIMDEIKMQDSYLIANESMDISQPEKKSFCKNGDAHSFDSDKSMELTSTLSSNQVKENSKVRVPVEDSYLKIDISILKELDFEENKEELKDVSLHDDDDNETKSLCQDKVSDSLEKNEITNDVQESSLEINSPKPETREEKREVGDNMTSLCEKSSRNNKMPEDDISSVSENQRACEDYCHNANPEVELSSLPKRMLSFESEGSISAKRMCVKSLEDVSRCNQSREATTVIEETASAQQMVGIATTNREVTSSVEQMCVTSSQDFTSNERSCDVNENEDPVSAEENCISSPLQEVSCSLFKEENETNNTRAPSISAVTEHELSETSMTDGALDLSEENQFLLCEDHDASNKFVAAFFGKSISGQSNNAENSSKIHDVEACDTVLLEDENCSSSLNINTPSETSSCSYRDCVNENININSRGKKLDTLVTDVGATMISTPVVSCTTDSESYKQHVEEFENQPSLKASCIVGETKEDSVVGETKEDSVVGETKEDSVEYLIRKSSQRKDCIWKIKCLSTQEWSFEFLGGTLELIINLESDKVSSINIVSHTDGESNIMQLAHRYLQNKLKRDYLVKVCRRCLDIPKVLKFVEHSVKYSQEFIQSFYLIEATDTAETDGKSVTFDIANLEMHRWFYVSLDLSSWAGQRLHPENINVKTVIGKIDHDEVRMLMKAVPVGPWFLRDFVKQVHWYVEECLKSFEKPYARDAS